MRVERAFSGALPGSGLMTATDPKRTLEISRKPSDLVLIQRLM